MEKSGQAIVVYRFQFHAIRGVVSSFVAGKTRVRPDSPLVKLTPPFHGVPMRPRSRPVSVQPATNIFAGLPSLDDKTSLVAVEEMEDISISLPLNLEELVLERFDQLLESGELFYHPSLPEHVEHNGFKV